MSTLGYRSGGFMTTHRRGRTVLSYKRTCQTVLDRTWFSFLATHLLLDPRAVVLVRPTSAPESQESGYLTRALSDPGTLSIDGVRSLLFLEDVYPW